MKEDPASEFDSAVYQTVLAMENPAAREEFLDRVYGPDDPAKSEMRDLIAAASEAARYFSDAGDERTQIAKEVVGELPSKPAPSIEGLEEEAPGSRVGRYQVVQRLGEGGCGMVYEAEQEHPIRRRVAVKVLRHGADSAGIIARFESERQALALMDHEGIAKILDGGTSETGRPYFVMELVKGERVTTYCDRHRLTVRERLDLFIQICEAIQHAHQKGVIHRDIKPSNILVVHGPDDRHSPKIIDFGIAKAAGPDRLGNPTAFTSHDEFIGTPVYASPEQLDLVSLDVDTRTDIYSLGVLLHELLTSHTPVGMEEIRGLSVAKLHRKLLDMELVRPSARLQVEPPEALTKIAEARRTEPAALIHALRGDLDWIVLKALEKERTRRYQTVNNLSTDIQRFLRDQAVLARPPSRVYLLQKFIRRNRLGVGFSAALILLLLLALTVTTSLYHRAERSRDIQFRLKNEAENARRQESRLRAQADARANVARVAMLLDQGRIDEADELRQKYPLSSIEPSLEAAAVFRSLGDWNAKQGRMAQALPCYRLLVQANRFDRPEQVLLGVDLLVIGVAFAEFAPEEYPAYREEVVETYMPPTGRIEAEHLLKACLLAPADAEFLQKIKPAADHLGDSPEELQTYWENLAMGLFCHRSGDHHLAVAMGEAGLRHPAAKLSCKVAIHAVMSMCYREMGDLERADEQIATADEMLRAANGVDTVAGQPVEACWWDWAIARTLVREGRQPLKFSKE
ncbi:serine/threonine protein kinase [Haloferula sargassicola]|uniref:Serine/threonine-protein kinase PknD n=1 Tax=Haloferula sargassicola TaxID=490096 RepID=A0ABP9USX7_9BACT